ncbi:hypothetical protein ONS95_000532 [Cadophora gregata]|uniref:uncharacterized protein n=1 Tax=Cadophora gregata TaxID=51156 RepID=UPI0026DDAC26|nr:uncharacterized protein ONS95_000532 [Cadophora gregata]KAK0125454.1 hypothetical protein ONS96_009295 [Cadophora gregata f. sp. sojae]KAK0128568.1 hypothetical protein ONS95_000532 [Cadophora gregata]
MDKFILFPGACNKNGISFSSLNFSIRLTPPVTPSRRRPLDFTTFTPRSLGSSISGNCYTLPVALTDFPIFVYLPPDIRKKIWRWAVKALPARTVLIQPYAIFNFADAAVNHEARAVFLEEYSMLHSRQAGRMSDFSMSINYQKDLLYLNRRFVLNPKIPTVTSLIEATLVYHDWLKPVKQLALNLKDTLFLLPRAWGQNPHLRGRTTELWDILGNHCPELRLLFLVDYEKFETGNKMFNTQSKPHRPCEWNVLWAKFRMGLDSAKIRKVVRQDMVLRLMDAYNVVPADLVD